MATRTIESPGVEWNEYDLSQVISYAGGTVVVVMGFAHQGPTNQVVEITSKEELMTVFFGNGGPQNAAERYFYHSSIEILNTPGKLLCIRLPYGSGKGSGFSTGYTATVFYGETVMMDSTEAARKFCSNGTGLTPAYFNRVWNDAGAAGTSQPVVLINPQPESFVISEELYQEIKDGALEDGHWSEPEYNVLQRKKKGVAYKVSTNPSYPASAYSTPIEKTNAFIGKDAIVLASDGSYNPLNTVSINAGNVDNAFLAYNQEQNAFNLFVGSAFPEGQDPPSPGDYMLVSGTYTTTSGFTGTYEYINGETTAKVMSGEAVLTAYDIDILSESFNLNGQEYYFNSPDSDTDEETGGVYQLDDEGVKSDIAEFSVKHTWISTFEDIAGAELFKQVVYLKSLTALSATDVDGRFLSVGIDRTSENGMPPGMYYIDARATPYYGNKMEGALIDALGKSVFFTVNKTESSIDKDYAGFYLTVCDQDAFVRRGHDAYSAVGTDIISDAFALSLDDIDTSESATSAYSAANEYVAYYVCEKSTGNPWIPDEAASTPIYSYGNAVAKMKELNKLALSDVYTVYVSADEQTGLKCTVHGDPLAAPAEQFRLTDAATTVPSRMRNFALNGTQSLSQSCVDSLPYVFSKTEFANALHIGVHRFFTNLENDRLSYATLETYTGSLNPDSTLATKNGGKENYGLARMTENHSSYIDIYTNPYFESTENAPILVRFGGKVNFDVYNESLTVSDDVSTEGVCVSLGGYRSCADENQNEYIGNLPAKIDNALLLIDSVLDRDIDILIDGGLSTIWAYTYGINEAMEKNAEDATGLNYDNTGYDAKEYDENRYITKALKNVLRQLGTDAFYDIREATAIRDSVYSIFTQFNVFCSKTRKDCIFISDPPRFFFVHGEDTKASSKKDWVFSLDMYHPIKNIYEAANTSYACTYMNWVKKYDNTLADFIWLPMSPFAAAIMCEVDAKYFMWWAPFGLNNGVLSTITDIAFRPNQGQCDYFYKTGFNPVCFFNDGGYVIWGQKTMLDKHSAFDRLNVRRLFLYLERRSMKAMRWYIGEPNTQFTRTQVLETLRPMYDYCVNNSGLYDYLLKCDEENNTPDIIDDNTLVVDIYLKPVRTIEFILLNFYACRTGADFSEIVG